jgi:hypothetical protein
MNRMSVNSDEFRIIGYDPVEMLMEVEMRDGAIYLYSDVPMAVYNDFLAAEDMWEFYQTYVDECYPYTQVK